MFFTRRAGSVKSGQISKSFIKAHVRKYAKKQVPLEDLSKKVSVLKNAWVVPENPNTVIPTYIVMDENGTILNPTEPLMPEELLLKCYTGMVTLHVVDQIMYGIHRQDRGMTFYMTSHGEEAVHFGSAAALSLDDIVYGQYRETGVLLYRGFTVQDLVNQCYSNKNDLGKGRQMPVHYGSSKLNFHTISSPLGTQIPQASGAGYALRLQKKKNVVICYFGDGAASEGDFHAAMNFAATLSCPTIFFCRNNRWAISTPTKEQYRGDAIAGRGVAYGMHTIRVDGNDIIATYNATKEAKRICVEEGKPVLIEAMTYRLGSHSTSDDPSRYRNQSEVLKWEESHPIKRLYGYLESKGLWNKERNEKLKQHIDAEIKAAIQVAETEKKPHLDYLFSDVYDTLTPELKLQKKELYAHVGLYPDDYPMSVHSDQL